MIELDEAIARCLAAAPAVREEEVGLDEARGRVLAAAVHAPGPVPPWDNSAMDGYAVRAADTVGGEAGGCGCDGPEGSAAPSEAVVLEVLETVAAGAVPRHAVRPGTAIRIMTGAMLPAGADAIAIREHTELLGGAPERVRVHGSVQAGEHVRRAGEELAPGDLVLPPGAALGPAALGLLASVGVDRVRVARRPRVAVISTGDELVPPGTPLAPGQIHSSNAAALVAWVLAAGGEPVDCGVARDDLESTRATFQRALDAGCDLLLSTGGVSVGDFDVVREAMGAVGAEMDFWRVRMKPGKPLAFGRIGGRPAFGLPGNPVSCQVGFLQFVRPVIRRALGDPRPFLPVLPARMARGFHKRPGRAELVRVRLELRGGPAGLELLASPTGDQGSHRGSSLALAHGLARMEADGEGAPEGALVPVQVFDWGFTDRAAGAW